MYYTNTSTNVASAEDDNKLEFIWNKIFNSKQV